MNEHARKLIATLGLSPLPQEGGFFRRTWTSVAVDRSGRHAGSAIYFLLTPDDFSAFHRMPTEELWLFHGGDGIDHVQLVPSQPEPVRTRLGPDFHHGDALQLLVTGGVWQGALLAAQAVHGWALCSCVMVPAWDDRAFELGNAQELRRDFPRATPWITALTR